MKENIFAIIPAYNEENRVADVVTNAKRYVDKVIVVDDGSSDKTYDAAKSAGAVTLKHIVNLGKGAALKTGCDYAITQGADMLIVLDADTQHDPEEIPNFIKTLKEADIVFE